MSLSPEAIVRHTQKPVPRYTSYPTAPHFHDGVGAAAYRDWLGALPEKARLSLYLHVPFCDTLCWFCGCHTKITRQYEPIAEYLEALYAEIDAISAMAPQGAEISHLHWGGGSPTILSARDSARLVHRIRSRFNIAEDFEFAVEVDPRGMDHERIDALIESGLTRVSVGVQDFDPAVQAAINRIQTIEETRAVIDRFRAGGVRSLNIDAIYGLPGQHWPQLERTLNAVIELRPDRIALFGYAHVPWMKRHQSMISTVELPDVLERYAQAETAAELLEQAGYQRAGIDHFALPEDSLARAAREGRLQRNFQGYTVDPADALLGLGASSIGKLPQGYVQNEPAIAKYQRAAHEHGLATVRGIAFNQDDMIRAEVIERLMCDLTFRARPLMERWGKAVEPILRSAESILLEDNEGFVAPAEDGFVITDTGRPFLRTIAARFDAYLGTKPAGHSLAV